MLIRSTEAGALQPRPLNPKPADSGFDASLAKALSKVDSGLKNADQAAVLATDDKIDIHQAALQIERAELNFRLTVKVRNKVVDAYREIMRMSA